MQLRDVMTRNPVSISKNATLQAAAVAMADGDIGSLPVTDGSKLVGIVTDRDIVIRALAKGKATSASVASAMTEDIVTCGPDIEVNSAARTMGDKQIRRLYVVENGDLVGVVALGDLAVEAPASDAGRTLREISRN